MYWQIIFICNRIKKKAKFDLLSTEIIQELNMYWQIIFICNRKNKEIRGRGVSSRFPIFDLRFTKNTARRKWNCRKFVVYY
jgi:hypothetical protein